jgi:hypothetical protein
LRSNREEKRARGGWAKAVAVIALVAVAAFGVFWLRASPGA